MQLIKSPQEFYAAIADLLELDDSLQGYYLGRAIKKLPYSSIIVLIDEAGLLFQDHLYTVCSWLRAMTDDYEFVLLALAASLIDLIDLETESGKTSPLYNVFYPLYL
ncbi:hypothetical protein Cri9333_0643 [Crinalium epipsammum PCC 9333]|uniref:Uncharacterized protein n=1 Tax=Crinalium epipsammum PCC 9333 TaxID=1173022 RepID=K9VUH3_9CYAN|nr:hypothetical protein [Crinalium epipsammum]AFZ11586.1 hypothetical protein Cri9333_0643 [Crinalium epipsammum PCC 9333]